jgi:tripartite-type tricarboxylate transporter receptor subunit TctC
MTSISAFNENVPFDPIKDFVPVTMVARNFGQILVVHPSMKANTVGELISLAKANPGKLNYASAGIGNITYIAAEQMKAVTGVQINDIQYKGTAPAISDLLGNHVDMCFAPGSIVLPLIQAGKLKALAITGPNRWKALPNLPTMQEAGLKSIELTGWFGVYLPAKTSPEIVNRIYTEIQKAFTDPDIVKRLDDTGFEVIVSRPDIFAKFSEDDVQSMKDLARKIGLNKK